MVTAPAVGAVLAGVEFLISTEELATLCRLCGVALPPGAPTDPFRRLDDRERALAMQVALDGLVAKAYVEATGGGRYKLPDALRAVVVTAGRPAGVLREQRTAGEHVVSQMAYGLPGLTVEHSSPRLGIHRFAVIDAADIASRVIARAGVRATQAEGPPIPVPADAVEGLRAEGRAGGPEAVATSLAGLGVDGSSAGAFARALTGGAPALRLESAYRDPQGDHHVSVLLVVDTGDEGGAWTHRRNGAEIPVTLSFEPATTDGVRAAVDEMLLHTVFGPFASA